MRLEVPHDTKSLIEKIKKAIFEFVEPRLKVFAIDEGNPKRTQDQKHMVARLTLRDCLENLLDEL